MEYETFDYPRIGIMGGAFNPFHNGHLRHAIEVAEYFDLISIEILPSAHHPHKNRLLPFDFRVHCIEAAIKEIHFLTLNPLENEIEGPSYSHTILTEWHNKNPSNTPFFLMGTEDFAELPSWYKGLELPELAHLLVVSRNGDTAEKFCHHAQSYWHHMKVLPCQQKHPLNHALTISIPNMGHCTFLSIPHIHIAATQIRQLWQQQKCLSGIVPESVLALLQEKEEILKKYWT